MDQKTFPSTAVAEKHGYTVVSDVSAPSQFQLQDLKPIAFMDEAVGEHFVTGQTLIDRSNASALKRLGLIDAEFIRVSIAAGGNCPHDFDEEYLVFTGTQVRDQGGKLCFPVLVRNRKTREVDICFDWVTSDDSEGHDWRSDGKFAALDFES